MSLKDADSVSPSHIQKLGFAAVSLTRVSEQLPVVCLFVVCLFVALDALDVHAFAFLTLSTWT